MAMRCEGERLVIDGVAAVEEAERLLELLHESGAKSVDLGACTHLHAALLQVLMAGGLSLAVAPPEPALARLVAAALER